MRDPVTLGVGDVDVRLQLAAQPAAQLLDPAAAESGHGALATSHMDLHGRKIGINSSWTGV